LSQRNVSCAVDRSIRWYQFFRHQNLSCWLEDMLSDVLVAGRPSVIEPAVLRILAFVEQHGIVRRLDYDFGSIVSCNPQRLAFG